MCKNFLSAYANETTLWAESEELKNLFMRLKEKNEKAGRNLSITVTSLHGKQKRKQWKQRQIFFLGSKITERRCCESAALNMPANLENSAVATGLEKASFHYNPKGNPKESSKYRTIALISHTSKVMLKILQDRLQQYMNHELPDVQVGFRKGRGSRDQIANIC